MSSLVGSAGAQLPAIQASVCYRHPDDSWPTVADYDEAIEALQLAKSQLKPDGQNCAICHKGHQAFECPHNPLLLARRWTNGSSVWACYHCGFVATDDASAVAHFGRQDGEVALCLRAEASQLSPVLKLARLGAQLLRDHRNDGFPGDIDGAAAQDAAEASGCITAQTVLAPCREGCACAEGGEFPATCYFTDKAVLQASSELLRNQGSDASATTLQERAEPTGANTSASHPSGYVIGDEVRARIDMEDDHRDAGGGVDLVARKNDKLIVRGFSDRFIFVTREGLERKFSVEANEVDPWNSVWDQPKSPSTVASASTRGTA